MAETAPANLATAAPPEVDNASPVLMTPALDSPLLHLGCGITSPPGWLNVDGSWQAVLARWPRIKNLLVRCWLLPAQQAEIPWGRNVLRMNLIRPLPFAQGRFQAVYSSHTLEHLHREDAQRLVQECFRVLRPGGVCRLVVPDLQALAERYVTAQRHNDAAAADAFMEHMRAHPTARRRGLRGMYYRLTSFHDHKWMYDARSLQVLMTAAGFVEVQAMPCLESRIEEIADVEQPGRILNGEGVAVEGCKPSAR